MQHVCQDLLNHPSCTLPRAVCAPKSQILPPSWSRDSEVAGGWEGQVGQGTPHQAEKTWLVFNFVSAPSKNSEFRALIVSHKPRPIHSGGRQPTHISSNYRQTNATEDPRSTQDLCNLLQAFRLHDPIDTRLHRPSLCRRGLAIC